MDPLSIASGVAGLVTLADVVISRTYNTVIACKHASEDSRKLLREVQALAGILQSLSSLESKLGTSALQSHIPAAQILSCQQTLQNIRDKLEKSDPKEDGISIFQKAKRTLKWPLSSSDTEKFLAEMERHKSTFDLALSADALDAILSSQQAGERTDTKIDHVVQALDRFCKIENTKEQRRILQLIDAGDADEAYRANMKLHQHGTGLWFLEEGKPFSTWLAIPCSRLWVHGIPGAGKTILSALAIGKAAESVSTTHGIVFYYCSHRNELSRHLTGILRCLVGQLARQNRQCMSLLEEKFGPQDHTSVQSWTRNDDELEILLRKMLRRFDDVSIVIDGIDECHEVTIVTDTLAAIASEVAGVRTLIFSRKEAEMEPFLEEFVSMSIAAESQDLRLYVPAQIEARTRLRKLRIKDSNVKDEIIETLVNGADGMFRWVACQLDHLCDLTTDDERLSALKRLPRTLESTYDRILERAHSRGSVACGLVHRSLLWIIHHTPETRPLTIQQVCEAVSIEDHASSLNPRKLVDAEEILINCSSLIRLSANGDRVESAHFTVEEYLRAIDPIRKPHLAQFRLCDDLANNWKAATCLTALSFDNIMIDNAKDLSSLLRWLQEFPFYYHAATCWFRYVSHCQLNDDIKSMTTELFCSTPGNNFEVWKHVWLLGWDDLNATRMCPVGSIPWQSSDRANDAGLYRPSSRTTSRTRSSTTSRTTSPTPSPEVIDGSCRTRNSRWVRCLGVAANSTKLHFAAMLHQEHLIVPLYREPGQLGAHNEVGTPLHCALLGIYVLRIIILGEGLEDFTPNVTWGGDDPAAKSTVKTLLRLGADLNAVFRLADGTERSTTFIAYWTEFLQDVLACGATVDRAVIDKLCENKRNDDDIGFLRTIDICKLPECDRPAAIGLLRSLGDPPEQMVDKIPDRSFFVRDHPQKLLPEYEDALIDACDNDDLPVFRWVFEASGIDINYRIHGVTLMQTACSSSSESLAEYLISHGANVNEPTTTASTPLGCLIAHKPSTGSTLKIMKSLLAAGASTTFLDNCNNNVLMIWVDQSYPPEKIQLFKEISEILLSSQPDLSQRNDDGRTVWHILAANTYGSKMMDILESDKLSDESVRSSIGLLDNQGWTPLHVAASKGHGKMMRALIDSGSETTQRTPEGKTILHLATAALGQSRLAFKIAVNADWDDAARESDGPAALIDWAAKYCETYHECPVDMAERLNNAIIKLTVFASATSNLEKSYVACIDRMVRKLILFVNHCPPTCQLCNAFIKCFTLLLQHSSEVQASTGDILAALITLCDGLCGQTLYGVIGEPLCSKAICGILETMAFTNDLERYLKQSRFVDISVSSGRIDLINAILKSGIDVDKVGFCVDDLSVLQRLCQCVAPKSAIGNVLSRTKSLKGCTRVGETLLHLVLQPRRDGVQRQTQEEVSRLLIQGGLDVNAKLLRTGMTALMISSASGWPEMTSILLKACADVSLCDLWGYNALSYANHHNCAPVIEQLIAHGSPFAYGKTFLTKFRPGRVILIGPFQAAAEAGSLEALRALYGLTAVEKDVEVRLKVPSPLWVACAANARLEIIQFLLKNDPQINYSDTVERMTPLHVAATLGDMRVIEPLLDAGCDPRARDYNGLIAATHAAIGGHQEVMRLLRCTSSAESSDERISVDQQRFLEVVAEDTISDYVMTIATTGTPEQLQCYALAGGDLKLRFRSCVCTPIIAALICGKEDIVKYLHSLHIRPIGKACHTHFPCNSNGLTADMALGLVTAQCNLLEPLRRVLTDSAPAVTSYTFTYAIHSAAANGNTEALELMLANDQLVKHLPLLRYRSLPIYRVENGQCSSYLETNGTVLHTAVQAGRLESVKILLQNQFDPDAFDLDGMPASHIAAAHGREDLMELLLSHGASVDVRDAYMRTTLGAALQSGQLNIVRLLLDRGADISARDYQNQSLFHIASLSGNPAMFFALTNAGLSASIEDIFSWYWAGHWQTWTTGDRLKRLMIAPEILIPRGNTVETKAVLNLVPSHCRKLNLTCRVMHARMSVLYSASTLVDLETMVLLYNAGAMLNFEGGGEGTPLMGACKAGRLEVAKFLVRHGAILNYEKHGVQVSAFDKAASYPKIQRWLLVERFTDQRMILDGEMTGAQAADMVEAENWSDEIADVTLDLVLEDDLERYLESKNWFLPMRRFVDDGQGAFARVPILQAEFARYRPLDFDVSPK